MRKCVLMLLTSFIFSQADYAQECHFNYCREKEVQKVEFIAKDIYSAAVHNLPICCVDIFLYDPVKEAYLLVLRDQAPACGIWWLPGGRLYKGESFEECAVRKCQEEVGLTVSANGLLGTYATVFPDSAWGCQTHTINTAVLAFVEGNGEAALDQYHQGYQWHHISKCPDDPYVRKVYREALKKLSKDN